MSEAHGFHRIGAGPTSPTGDTMTESLTSPPSTHRVGRRDIKGEKRRAKIVDLLTSDLTAGVSVAELAAEFGVSVATIRRDLADLQDLQLITRTYGGAALSSARTELSMNERQSTNAAFKRAIGRAAAALVEDGDLIILDAGSTTEQVALALGNRHVTVVTNGLRAINRLVAYDKAEVLVLGGSLRGFNETIYGSDAEEMLRRVYARFAFVGADAVDPERGVASRTYGQSRLKSLMLEQAATVFVVADSTKLEDGDSPYWSELPRRWGLVTDSGASPAALTTLKDAGASPVIIA